MEQALQKTGKAPAKSMAGKHQEAQAVAPELRQQMIAEAAYFIAERRGFQGDRALDDWLQAEAALGARSDVSH